MTEATDTPNGDHLSDWNFNRWVIPPLKNCWYLTGPTSSGKSPLAMAIARQLDAEIISMDSMAIYRGMDIGTAKPPLEHRQAIPHHQLDIVEPTELYSAANYVMATHKIADEIRARGRHVLICGGTPLYLKSLLRGFFVGPEPDWEFRESIQVDIQRLGLDVLRQRLMQVDPLLAHKLHPNDSRRMIRGLEVARVTGQPLSHWQEQFEVPAKIDECPSLVLKLERAWLHQLINDRVQRMVDTGLEAEVAELIAKHGQLSRTASQAVGYREMLARLDTGASLAETVELIRAHTRQFARRQEIWFRGLSELQPLPLPQGGSPLDLADQAVAFFRQFSGQARTSDSIN